MSVHNKQKDSKIKALGLNAICIIKETKETSSVLVSVINIQELHNTRFYTLIAPPTYTCLSAVFVL